MKASVDFETIRYERAYGKKPRGIGHWAFSVEYKGIGQKIFWANGTYAEAKKMVKEEIQKFAEECGKTWAIAYAET